MRPEEDRRGGAIEEGPIQLFVPTFRVDECLREIRECLEKGWTGLGFKTVTFEAAWKAYSGLPHAHFVASATAGLHLALQILKDHGGWLEGDEVITTPLTFVSTNHAILHSGLRPVFADVDDHLCLDPETIECRLSPRTRAVMFVGLGGNTGQLPRIAAWCRSRGLRLVLDAAHMAGTRLDGKHVGGEADAAVFSFQAVKNLPTADSGMLCFREQPLDEAARKWSWLGINKDTYSRTNSSGQYRWRYDVEYVGFKYHSNSIMAALALVGLKYLDRDNEYRRALANTYDQGLSESCSARPVAIAPGCESSRHLYQVLVDDRDALMTSLNARNIYPGVHYADNTTFRMYASADGSCPRARWASDHLISLPLHLGLTDREISRVVRAVVDFVNCRKPHA